MQGINTILKSAYATALVLILLIAGSNQSNAQQVIMNTNGERIVIYPDGSWRYYEEADSVLTKQKLTTEEPIVQETDPIDPFEAPSEDPEEVEELMRIAHQFAESTYTERRQANIRLSRAMGQKFELETQLEQARQNSNLIEPDKIASLEDALDAQIEAVKAAKQHLKVCTRFADRAKAIVEGSPKKREANLSKLMVEHKAYYGTGPEIATSTKQQRTKQEKPPRSERKSREKTNDRSVEPQPKPSRVRVDDRDPYAGYRRAPRPCNYIVQDISPGSEQKRVVVNRKLVFTHTDDELRPYFRQQELVTCTGQLTKLDDQIYLSVEFSIASPNARKNFGSLENGSLLRLRLINQSDVNLYNIKADRGRIDPYSGNTLFVGRYLIDKESQKALERYELDKMRVVWSTGYEDYDIYELDFFIDQLSCLTSLE